MRMLFAMLIALGASGGFAEAPEAPKMEGANTLPAVLDLDTAQQRALADNPSLQSVAARVRQAKESIVQARSLYYPQLATSYSASHTELPDATVKAAEDATFQAALGQARSQLSAAITNPLAQFANVGNTLVTGLRARDAIDDSLETYTVGITASYLLFDGFNRKYTHAIARFGYTESQAAQAEATRLLLDAVAQSFFGVQLARQNIAINKADEAFNQRLLLEAKARKEVGLGSTSDVLNFEVRLRAAKTQRLLSERDLEVARIGLATLMGLEEARLPEGLEVAPLVDESAEDMQMPEEEACIAYALDHRPDFLQRQSALKRADAGVGQQRAAFFPQVALFASQDASRSENSRFEEDDFSTTLGVNVSLDLFTGFRNRSRLKQARQAREEAQWNLTEAELSVLADVRQRLETLKVVQEQVILQRDTTTYVERNRDLSEKEYNAGQGALARLNQAQRDLIEAQGLLALARVSLRQAWHELYTATAEVLKKVEEVATE